MAISNERDLPDGKLSVNTPSLLSAESSYIETYATLSICTNTRTHTYLCLENGNQGSQPLCLSLCRCENHYNKSHHTQTTCSRLHVISVSVRRSVTQLLRTMTKICLHALLCMYFAIPGRSNDSNTWGRSSSSS